MDKENITNEPERFASEPSGTESTASDSEYDTDSGEEDPEARLRAEMPSVNLFDFLRMAGQISAAKEGRSFDEHNFMQEIMTQATEGVSAANEDSEEGFYTRLDLYMVRGLQNVQTLPDRLFLLEMLSQIPPQYHRRRFINLEPVQDAGDILRELTAYYNPMWARLVRRAAERTKARMLADWPTEPAWTCVDEFLADFANQEEELYAEDPHFDTDTESESEPESVDMAASQA